MKALYLLLLSLCWLSSWSLQNVYITPDGNCSTASGTVLEPCYTLNQAGNLSSYVLESSVTLLFLSGTHILEKKLEIDKFEEVVMSPLTMEDEVVINCTLMSSLKDGNIDGGDQSITISSLHFTNCSLVFSGNLNLNVLKSIFRKSQLSALSFECKVNCGTNHVNIRDCKFLSNAIGITAFGRDTSQQHLLQHSPQLNITNTLFQDNGQFFNRHDSGVLLVYYHYAVYVSNTQFIQNRRSAVMATYSSTLNLVNTTFYNNTVYHTGGSAISLREHNRAVITNCSFVDNTVTRGVGAISIESLGEVYSITNSRFQGNVADRGGAIYARLNDKNLGHLFIRDCQFVNNSANQGGALCLSGSKIVEKIDITMSLFIFNKARQGGAVYSESDVVFENDSFMSNSAKFSGGAVFQSQSTFHGINVIFSSNTALNGGAMYAGRDSIIKTCNITLVNNAAHDKGGAIFVSDKYCGNPAYIFCIINLVNATFSNNTASQGQTLYGGLLDRCNVDGTPGIDYFKNYSHYDDTVKSAITSDPVRLCLCNQISEVDCATRHLTVDKQRGQTIDLTVVVVDQVIKAKKAFVRASYENYMAEFGKGEERQQTGDNCTDMPFHVFAHDSDSAVLVLRPEGICEQSYFSTVIVAINIIPCTSGFVRNNDRCVCDPRLSDYVTSCDVDALTIHAKESRVWIHYDELFLRVHSNCPLDYCEVSMTIAISSQDEQCAYHRSGVICGSCRENYSIALGGSKCLNCSSSIAYAWLIPVFALAGIALIALLLICNMTISHGTLNGLIFYANVVSISRLTNFQDCSVHPVFSVFIAWVNLDSGIETCFYAGMDTYQKTWLQFVFPLYIWILVGAIILVSHYSTRAVKVFGKNNIAVLATLFLLSYTKFLKTIITALNVTQVLRASATNASDSLVPYSVWVYDGNIEYLKGKHVPLFSVALAFLIFLFLPYTLLLTFGQCIRSIRSRSKCVLWCIRSTAFVSIMDAYHAPYFNRHRYWTGLMLFVRCIIFLGFAFSVNNFFSKMFIALACLSVIFSLRAISSKVYKNLSTNLVEIIFLLNLTILSAAVLYLRSSSSSDDVLCTCTNASISVSLAMFIAIFVYHAYINMTSRIKWLKTLEHVVYTKWHARHHYNRVIMPDDDNKPAEIMQRANASTRSVVELREELLDSAK